MFEVVKKNDREDVAERFHVHKLEEPDNRTLHWMANMRRTYAAAAVEIEKAIPPTRERALALTKLEEAMFWTSAAAAHANGRPSGFGEPDV